MPVKTPFGIGIGEKVAVFIGFTPAAIANYNDKLTIVHDGSNVASPSVIHLEGSGRTLTSRNFSYTGSTQNFTIPAGVSLIKVTANGAGGGGQNGGKGGKMVGLVNVTPGDTYKVMPPELVEEVKAKLKNGTYRWMQTKNS